jgi:hypothetical protein
MSPSANKPQRRRETRHLKHRVAETQLIAKAARQQKRLAEAEMNAARKSFRRARKVARRAVREAKKSAKKASKVQ